MSSAWYFASQQGPPLSGRRGRARRRQVGGAVRRHALRRKFDADTTRSPFPALVLCGYHPAPCIEAAGLPPSSPRSSSSPPPAVVGAKPEYPLCAGCLLTLSREPSLAPRVPDGSQAGCSAVGTGDRRLSCRLEACAARAQDRSWAESPGWPLPVSWPLPRSLRQPRRTAWSTSRMRTSGSRTPTGRAPTR